MGYRQANIQLPHQQLLHTTKIAFQLWVTQSDSGNQFRAFL